VIGSSCIGASVIGGICNNSGGSLVQRGPPTPRCRARIDENGKLTLVNHLGLIWASRRNRSSASSTTTRER
jgi:D-lactate dehydrogenase